MRKTSLIFLLFVEIVALFLFYNFNHLFVELGKAEIRNIKDQARQVAALAEKSAPESVELLKKNPLFSAVGITQEAPGEQELVDLDPPLLLICYRTQDGPTVKLTVPVQSGTLQIIRRVQAVSTGSIVLSGILLLATAALLFIQIRKGKSSSSTPVPIDPLQNYLLNLKGQEIKMQQMVASQRQSVEQKDSLTVSILNQVHFAVITLGKGQRIEIFNRRAEQILQKSYASVIHRPFGEALPQYPELIDFALRADKAGQTREIVTQDLILNCSVVTLPYEAQLLTIEDVTGVQEKRRLDMEKKSILQLGEMAAYLSHEVRNSLGVIYGYTKTLKDNDPKIERINAEIHFLTDMMERFLGFSKPAEPPQQVPCRIDDLVRELCETHKLTLSQRHQEHAQAIADPGSLRNVLDNLVRNAAQAGATEITCSYRRERRSIELTLGDNGQGIPAELTEKIWYPFFTTREKGSGMGLALVRKLMLAMGGEISLQSGTAGDTRFSLKLPTDQA